MQAINEKADLTVKVTRIVPKAMLVEEGAYVMLPLSEGQFKEVVATIPEEDFLADTAFMGTALHTLTGRDPAIGSRSLRLKGGEAAVVFDVDAADAWKKKSVGASDGTFNNIDYVRSHCKMWLVIKVDTDLVRQHLMTMITSGINGTFWTGAVETAKEAEEGESVEAPKTTA